MFRLNIVRDITSIQQIHNGYINDTFSTDEEGTVSLRIPKIFIVSDLYEVFKAVMVMELFHMVVVSWRKGVSLSPSPRPMFGSLTVQMVEGYFVGHRLLMFLIEPVV